MVKRDCRDSYPVENGHNTKVADAAREDAAVCEGRRRRGAELADERGKGLQEERFFEANAGNPGVCRAAAEWESSNGHAYLGPFGTITKAGLTHQRSCPKLVGKEADLQAVLHPGPGLKKA